MIVLNSELEQRMHNDTCSSASVQLKDPDSIDQRIEVSSARLEGSLSQVTAPLLLRPLCFLKTHIYSV